MNKPERNRGVLENFVLHLTHCSHPKDGEDPEFKTEMVFTPEILYRVVNEYIAGDHVDGYDGAEFPFSEGDDYWTLEDTLETYEDRQGVYEVGGIAVQSCWDDQSEDFHKANPDREYFNSLDEVLQYAWGDYEYIKVSCFNCNHEDIKTGDYLVAPKFDKFHKSY